MTPAEKLNFALSQLDRTQAFHSRVDGRAAMLLTLNVAMASITIINFKNEYLHTLIAIPACFGLAVMGYAFIYIILVTYSHLSNKIHPSMLFFGDIARITADDYIANVKAANEDELIEDALCQIWRNSEILAMKFKRANRAYYATCIAIIFWIIFLSSVTFKSGALPMLSAH